MLYLNNSIKNLFKNPQRFFMFLEECEIIENIKISEDKYLLKVKSEKSYKYTKAGQFFMLECKKYLRRAISVHNADKNILEFYYQVKGDGTKNLSEMSDAINMHGPLGNGFETNIKNKNLLLAAGGMGIAPFKFLINKLKEKNNITLIFGGANESAIKIIEYFDTKNIKLYITTDDGSIGDKCNCVDKTKEVLKENNFDLIYTCGPEIMMKGIIKSALENNIKCFASMEQRMACGVNACLGCNIEIFDNLNKEKKIKNAKVCHDGPVFDAKYLAI